ncbi:MAG: DUF4124 domain-containing protein [Thioalkalispiraceae bacterium]|jgi:hypothetical protein
MSVYLRILVNLAIFSLIPVSSAFSAIYKCTDSEGNMTFSQLPCAKDETSSKQHLYYGKSTPPNEEACSEAQSFSRHLLVKLQNQDKIGSDVIEELGGLNHVKPAVISIINYVSSFRRDKTTTANRISSLTETKCKNEGFGYFVVDDFPRWREAWGIPEDKDTNQVVAPANTLPAATKPSAENFSDSRQKALEMRNNNRCAQAERSLDNLRKRMRRGYSDAQGESLREQERRLVSRRSQYCQ